MGSGILYRTKGLAIVKVKGDAFGNRQKKNKTELENENRQKSYLKCFKIRLLFEENTIAYNVNLAGTSLYSISFEYAIYINYVKNMHGNYLSAQSYFASQVHEICFNGDKVKNGIKVMMISVFSNQSAKFKVIKNFPFIEVENLVEIETSEIFKSYQTYMKEIENALENDSKKLNKSIVKMNDLIRDLGNCTVQKKRQDLIYRNLDLAKKCILVAEDLIKEANLVFDIVTGFWIDCERYWPEWKTIGEVAAGHGHYSGERIVHNLFIK